MDSNRNSNRRIARANIVAVIVSMTVILFALFFSLIRFEETDWKKYDNQSRLLTAAQREAIERGDYQKGKYPYIVFDLEGKVLYSEDLFGKKKGDKVNVQEMIQTDRSFATENEKQCKELFVLEDDKGVSGFVVYMISEEEAGIEKTNSKIWHALFPFLMGGIVALLILISRIYYCNRRMLLAIRDISTSSKAIIAGNYDYEVVRVYETRVADNEIGDLIYSFELMRDELKNKQVTEEMLKKSQQELISCISHDLKTPLSTVKAYAEGIRDGIAGTEESRRDYIRIIINKTDLLIGMIGDLLNFSNAQLKQLDINKKEVYFKTYFQQVMEELKVFIEQRNMQFTYEINMEEMLVEMDEKRITEVLYNLAENSIKYSSKAGRIKITAKRTAEGIQIHVTDNGIGIHGDDIPYVFDKFYRAEKSRSLRIPGSGLGLSICKYIVEEHGGEITCYSRKGEGCEIIFTIHS